MATKEKNPQIDIKGFTDSQELVEMRGIGVVTGFVSFVLRSHSLRRSSFPQKASLSGAPFMQVVLTPLNKKTVRPKGRTVFLLEMRGIEPLTS